MNLPGLLRTSVALLVLGSIAAAAAPVFWHWSGDVALPLAPAATTPAPVAPQAAPVDIDQILAFAPFGSTLAPPQADEPLGETTLDLVLLGVILRSDPALSRALISNAGTDGQFAPGDPITDRATLVEVAADHAILRVDGQLQTLSFPQGPDTENAAAMPVVSGTDRLLAAVTAQNSAAAPEPETTQDYIDLWRERIRANPGEVLSAIGLIPTDQGYVIAEQHDSGVRRAGLRAGDLVKTVNGQTVGNTEQDRELYDEVAASGMATIEVERDGRTIVMSFPLQ